MYILGIETSCDETGAAVVEDGKRIISNVVASQVHVHAEYGGVVPELASRNHILTITGVIEQSLEEAGCTLDDISGVAVTHGPGLVGSLLIGLSVAKSIAFVKGVPIIPVHHVNAHVYSSFLGGTEPEFPFLALVVSGGHTSIIDYSGRHDYRLLGRTRDDAAGEAFDKVAKLLGLSYPGGPAIEKEAAGGDESAIAFPRPMTETKGLDFSFSGLKTAVLYHVRDLEAKGIRVDDARRADIAASFQRAVVDTLIIKTRRALKATGRKVAVLAGGVAANSLLREQFLQGLGLEQSSLHIPSRDLCVDNGAMVASAGYFALQDGRVATLSLGADPNLPLTPAAPDQPAFPRDG